MRNKLNLTIDEKVLARAKEFSETYGISLSQLVEMFLKEFTGPDCECEDRVKRRLLDVAKNIRQIHRKSE